MDVKLEDIKRDKKRNLSRLLRMSAFKKTQVNFADDVVTTRQIYVLT